MATVTMTDQPSRDGRELSVFIENQFDTSNEIGAVRQAIKEMTKQYAESWIEEHLGEIYGQLNVEAIANIILIEVAKQVKTDITTPLKEES